MYDIYIYIYYPPHCIISDIRANFFQHPDLPGFLEFQVPVEAWNPVGGFGVLGCNKWHKTCGWYMLSGWWFQNIWMIFHFIYGMSSQPHWLSLHHFSKWWNCTTNQLCNVKPEDTISISIYLNPMSSHIWICCEWIEWIYIYIYIIFWI